ncbi:MAG: ATP-binding protein [Clostridia bacterium]
MLRDISLHILDLTQNSVTAGANSIRIAVSAEAALLAVQIEDNGCGMSEDFLKAVEDPFTTSRKTRKVGMGIPFFKLACEQAGGRFEIRSKLNAGTKLSGSFEIANIDRLPLGDLGETMEFLISGAPDTRFLLQLRSSKGNFTFDTEEVKAELGDTPITEYDILQWIKEYINENVQIIFGGVLNEIVS